jgi:hypothetical protein
VIVKFNPAEQLFLKKKRHLGLDDVQIGKDAIFALAQALDAKGLALAEKALKAFLKDNEKRRRLLRIPERRRLTDDDVEVALEGDG